ncbi:MAG TPA: hypothetical protein VLE72_00185, partial [Candidatus Saccharimonadales bacterium]|nr:hypothetical protein [Candidatus Saccharimonadales bacterium]
VEHLQKLESSRVDRMKHMVEHLQSIGFKISISDVQAAAGDSIIGSPHIVKAVQKHPENLALEKELLAKMKEQAKTSEDVKAKFEQMVEAGIVQYPYRLYMKASSFIPMPRAESYTALLSLEDSVDLIHQAGGVAVLAHWYFHTTIFKAARLEEAVGAGKLDGLETSTDNTTFDGDVTSEVEMLRRLIEKYQLAEVMGSDSHSVEDLAAFAKGPNAELSVGHTQKIIDKFKPNLEWSNF